MSPGKPSRDEVHGRDGESPTHWGRFKKLVMELGGKRADILSVLYFRQSLVKKQTKFVLTLMFRKGRLGVIYEHTTPTTVTTTKLIFTTSSKTTLLWCFISKGCSPRSLGTGVRIIETSNFSQVQTCGSREGRGDGKTLV